ncbi:hypothetical protein NBRC3257_2383 [Gluconobacter thailandicus NBRC 3257]|uniref:Uncharacterized protein n=1 Tax=Gluconobacter thailandicus NBRC 3257 TaxID=1381097 RepID=A0ABQ0IYU4_GLUTH|nr:hypothetical protein NBRC3255_0756 [Gluconobacter thailandicus NBRC 3255]GAD27384.1 hypothetical protein NBRC3257_2383 [Gluconobacter thailandicus NBRC 3257]
MFQKCETDCLRASPLSAGNSQIHFIAPGATLGWIATALGLIGLWLGFRQTEGPKAL